MKKKLILAVGFMNLNVTVFAPKIREGNMRMESNKRFSNLLVKFLWLINKNLFTDGACLIL